MVFVEVPGQKVATLNVADLRVISYFVWFISISSSKLCIIHYFQIIHCIHFLFRSVQ